MKYMIFDCSNNDNGLSTYLKKEKEEGEGKEEWAVGSGHLFI